MSLTITRLAPVSTMYSSLSVSTKKLMGERFSSGDGIEEVNVLVMGAGW